MAANESETGKPDNGSSTRRASWRGAGTGAAVSTRSYRFRSLDKTDRQAARQNVRRRLKLAVLSSIVLALFGAFGWWFLQNPHAPPLLALAITRYDAPLPPNSFAVEDVARLVQAAKGSAGGWRMLTITAVTDAPSPPQPGRADLNRNALDEQGIRDQISQWLNSGSLVPGGPDRRVWGSGGTVVVYVSGHGVVDEQGRACIIPASTAPTGTDSDLTAHLDTNRWLPVAKIVAALDEARPDVKKLLVLDCSRLGNLWPLGVLYHGFAEALPEAVEKAKTVAILTSAGPGEVAWPSFELQGTPFGFYVARALVGDPAADLVVNDGKISASELAKYVQDHVAGYVRQHRYAVQRPQFVSPPGLDFNVVSEDSTAIVDSGGQPTSLVAPPSDLSGELDALKLAWAQLDALWQRARELELPAKSGTPAVWSEHCLNWHSFQRELLHGEALAMAGSAYADAGQSCLRDLSDRAGSLAAGRRDELPTPSLALARRWGRLKENQALRGPFAAWLRGEKPDVPADAKHDYVTRAELVWQWFAAGQGLGGPTGRQARETAIAFLKPPSSQNDVVELQLARVLTADAPATLWNGGQGRLSTVLALRAAAEEAAAPRDVRAHYILAPRLKKADLVLRRFENALFLGDDAWRQAEASLAEDQQSYQDAARDAEKLATLFVERDRAWAELPYLAEWLALRAAALGGDDGLVQVERQIRRLRELDVRVDAYLEQTADGPLGGERTDSLPALSEAAAQIDRACDGWRETLKAEARLRPGDAPDNITLRSLSTLLATPLVAGDERAPLHELYGDALRGLVGVEPETAGAARPGPANAGPPPSPADVPPEGGEARLAGLGGPHPAWTLLASEEELTADAQQRAVAGEQPWQSFARQGGLVRQRLKQLIALTMTETPPDREEANPRSRYSAAERQLRPAAALCAAGKFGRHDPIDRLARFDLNQFLAGSADRALDDFWASVDDESQKKPYFALVCEALEQAASKLADDPRAVPADFKAPWKTLSRKRQQLKEAADNAKFGEPWQPLSTPVGGVFQRKVPLVLPQLPPGDSALYVLDANGKPHETEVDGQPPGERVAVSVGDDSSAAIEKTLTVKMAVAEGSGAAPGQSPDGPWSMVWSYRGHRRIGRFSLAGDKGLVIVYEPDDPDKASITVTGEEMTEASIVFILDCSGSMSKASIEKDDREKPGRSSVQLGSTRMKKAIEALTSIVDQLPTSQRTRVGLWLYGRRLNWTDDKPPKRYEKPNLEVPPPKEKTATNDVERVIELQSLTEATKDQFRDAVKKAEPWGETPLYLSIAEAVSESGWDASNSQRHILLITDGGDFQSESRYSHPAKDTAAKALKKDRERHRQNPIKLHVFDCRPPGVIDKYGESSAELEKFVQQNGGDYRPVGGWDELEGKLRKALGRVAEYRITPSKRPAEVFDDMPLGKITEIPGPFKQLREYQVEVIGRTLAPKTVTLQGGEALRLSIFRPGTPEEQLVFDRYTRGEANILQDERRCRKVPRPQTVADNGPASSFVIAHRPQPEQRVSEERPWTFPVSLQDGDEPPGFSPRPTEAWIEITPLVGPDDQPLSFTYPFYDMLFESDTPVPVLLCKAPDWPRESRRAEIRAWFKFAPTPLSPSKIPTIGGLASTDDPQAVPGLLGVQIGVDLKPTPDGWNLVVLEQHTDETLFRWLRVETEEPPDSIIRTFGESGGWAKHAFFFRGAGRDRQAALLKQQLWLTTQEALKAGARAVEAPPLRVGLDADGS